jgi:hypothetical protein
MHSLMWMLPVLVSIHTCWGLIGTATRPATAHHNTAASDAIRGNNAAASAALPVEPMLAAN